MLGRLRQRQLDFMAIAISGLCLLHCLLIGLFGLALPLLAVSIGNGDGIHLGLLLLAAPVAAFALGSGCRRHRRRWLLGLGAVALLLMWAAVTEQGRDYELLLTALGVSLLTLAHGINLHLSRSV